MSHEPITPDEPPTRASFWHDVHRRLEATRAAIEQGWRPSSERKKEIFRARARKLAEEPKERTEAGAHIEAVEFLLAHERYAIESARVREICPLKEITPLPCTPPFVVGIINLRGQIVSVIDLKTFFDLPERGRTELSKVIIAHSGDMELGILADAVRGLRSIPVSELQPSLPTLTGLRAEYLRGVTKDRLAVLDVERLLFDEKIIVHEEV